MKIRSPWPSVSVHRLSLVTVALVLLLPGKSATAREWTQVLTPTANDLTAVHFSDSMNGYASGAFGTLLKTTNGGGSWAVVPTPVNFSFVSVWSHSADSAMVGRVGLYGTDDCGKSWDSDIGGFEKFSSSIFDILFTTKDIGFFIKEGNVFRSDDGGAEWSLVGGSGQFLDDIHYAGGQTIYATGGITFIEINGAVDHGQLERSRDGGLTWAPVLLEGIGDIHAAAWRSEQEGFVFTFSNTAHRTTDGGDSWSLVTDSMVDDEGNRLPAIVTDALIDDDGRFIGVDFNGNLLESDDAATWTVIPGSRDPLSALTKLPDGSLIAVGNGGAIWRSQANQNSHPPRITGIQLGSDEKGEIVTIDAVGTPGLSYQLTSSKDLSANWTIETSLTPSGSPFQFMVGKPDTTPWFYRVEEQSTKPITRQ